MSGAGRLDCQTTTGSTASGLALAYSASESLFSLALDLQTKIIISLLAVAGALFFIGLFFLVLLKRNFKTYANAAALKRRKFHRQGLFSATWASVGFALASVASLDQTTGALQYATKAISLSPVYITSGIALRVLQWLILAFSATFAIGISSIFTSRGSPTQSAGAMPSLSAPRDSAPAPPPPPPPPPPS